MATWPGLPFPQKLARDSLSVDYQSPVLRTENDIGPAKTRLRFTAAVRRIRGRLPPVDGTQLATFRTFYETTIAYGALSFDWTDPLDESTRAFRMIEAPGISLARPGTVSPGASIHRLWIITLQMEILP
ncbi:MAG: hypothetical protein R3349_01120 [Geminicoccaceae bacterium]|nr:hypothetical protein [Geminicoccaceae bacterium]